MYVGLTLQPDSGLSSPLVSESGLRHETERDKCTLGGCAPASILGQGLRWAWLRSLLHSPVLFLVHMRLCLFRVAASLVALYWLQTEKHGSFN